MTTKIRNVEKLNRAGQNDINADDEGNSFFDKICARDEQDAGRSRENNIEERESRALFRVGFDEFDKFDEGIDERDGAKSDGDPFGDFVSPNDKTDADTEESDAGHDFF